MKTPQFAKKLYIFYRDGFRGMTVGKTLWFIALLKLFIMFFVLKLFFFPNYLNSRYADDKGKADHVRQELLKQTR